MLIYTLRKILTENAVPLAKRGDAEIGPGDSLFALYVILSALLILFGGIFAGLTIGIMNQDEIYLQVLTTSGTAKQSRQAHAILDMFKRRGKHLVLVTLLLCNVITNETLPIVLDRIAGGGVTAVVASSVFVIIFGEIIPQSLCVKFGLSIGAFFAPFVEGLGLLLYPVSKPIALLLDAVLGEPHGNTYEKSGLKTLVSLHSDINTRNGLTHDEILIISSVLDLKQKSVSDIMTPIDDVYKLSDKSILNEDLLIELKNLGHSRIPVYDSENSKNFKGMLLVKQLITYDPMDEVCISEFPLKTLPETLPSTSCLNLLNYFQTGKSHMCLISETPGLEQGCLGIVTLEDIMEEMIGEEIQDETEPLLRAGNSSNGLASQNITSCTSLPSNSLSKDTKNYKSTYTVLPNENVSEDQPQHIVHMEVPVDADDELHIHRTSKAVGDSNGISEEIITIRGINKTVIVQDQYSQSYGSTSSEVSNKYVNDDESVDPSDLEAQSSSSKRGRNNRRGSMTSIKSWFSAESKTRSKSRSRSKSKSKSKSNQNISKVSAEANNKKVQPRNEPKFGSYLMSMSDNQLNTQKNAHELSAVDSQTGTHVDPFQVSSNVVSDQEENEISGLKWGKDRKEDE
ncbi:hypothetical protein QEN19_003642 [Hanseniaspora menglaensis]